jgi:hypothetical protein
MTLTSCETATQCDRLTCSSSSGTCDLTFFLPPADGTQCGATNQCVSGLCAPSAALKDYAWRTGAWSVCVSGGTSTRTVTCVDESGATSTDSRCDPDTRPAASRTCL